MGWLKCEGDQPKCLEISEIVAEPFSAPDRCSAALVCRDERVMPFLLYQR
jgi:hypothetical protein